LLGTRNCSFDVLEVLKLTVACNKEKRIKIEREEGTNVMMTDFSREDSPTYLCNAPAIKPFIHLEGERLLKRRCR
jgi:hypothetical protein